MIVMSRTRSSPNDVDVAALVDQAAITAVAVEYARALDERDWGALGECFTGDCVVEYEGSEPLVGPSAVVDACRSALGPLDVSQHLLGNHFALVDGDTASARSSLHAQHVRSSLAPDDKFVVSGTYHDRLRRVSGGWRIESRRLVVGWTDGNPAVLA